MHREPDSAESYKKRAELSARMSDLTGAEEDYTNALRLNPNDADAYRKRAEIRIRKSEKTTPRAPRRSADDEKFYKEFPLRIWEDLGQLESGKKPPAPPSPDERKEFEFKAAMADLDAAQRIDPKDTKTHRMRARFLFNRKEFKAAEDALDAALVIDNKDIAAYSLRAQTRQCQNNYKGAVVDWTSILQLKPESRYYTLRAYAREQLGDYNGAADDYKQSLKLDPYSTNSGGRYGYLRKKAGHDPSKENWAELVQIDPKQPLHSYASRASLRWEQGDLSGAVEDYSEILRHNPNDFDALSGRAYVRDKLNDFKGAIEDLNQCFRLRPKGYELHTRRAYARLMHGDYEGAADDYNSVKENSRPSDPGCREAERNYRFAQKMQKNNRGGLAYYDEYLRTHPQDSEAYMQRAEFRRLVRHEFYRDLNGAEADLDQAVRIDPRNAEALKARADLRSFRGNAKGAAADYKAALAINPKDTEAEKNYKSCHSLDFDAMFAEYTLAIANNPNDHEAYVNRAGIAPRVSADKRVDYKGQIADLTEALRINPKDPETYHLRAEAYKQQGELKAAIEDYTECLKQLAEYAKDYKGPHRMVLDQHISGLYLDRAQAYEGLKDYKRALDDCNKSIAVAPLESKLGPAMYRMGLYRKAGDQKGFNEAMQPGGLLMNLMQSGNWGGFP